MRALSQKLWKLKTGAALGYARRELVLMKCCCRCCLDTSEVFTVIPNGHTRSQGGKTSWARCNYRVNNGDNCAHFPGRHSSGWTCLYTSEVTEIVGYWMKKKKRTGENSNPDNFLTSESCRYLLDTSPHFQHWKGVGGGSFWSCSTIWQTVLMENTGTLTLTESRISDQWNESGETTVIEWDNLVLLFAFLLRKLYSLSSLYFFGFRLCFSYVETNLISYT